MRKAFIILLAILTILFGLSSCSCTKASPLEIVTDFERKFNTGGSIYSTEYKEGQQGYVSPEMEKALFPEGTKGLEYSLLMYSSLYELSELCVFSADGSGEKTLALTLAEERLLLISSFSKGERFVYEKGGIVAYGFFDNAEEAKKLLKSLI